MIKIMVDCGEESEMKFRKKPVVIEAFQMTPERRASNAAATYEPARRGVARTSRTP